MIASLIEMFPKIMASYQGLVLTSARDIAMVYPEFIKDKKNVILDIKAKNPLVADTCDSLIDIIEGRR